MLAFSTVGNDLIVKIAGTSDQIRIVNGFRNGNFRVEQLRFADGSVKSYAQIMAVLSTGGAGDDVLVDDDGSSTLTGGGGNDSLNAFWGNDRLIGGTGNDLLEGGGDDDVYVFNLGDGQDTINDWRGDYTFYSGGANDAIEFGAGITWDMLRITGTAYGSAVIEIVGSNDRIEIASGFSSPNFRIEQLRFADG